MEVIEIFSWIALGFVPMLSASEIFGRSRGERKIVELETHTRGGGAIVGL